MRYAVNDHGDRPLRRSKDPRDHHMAAIDVRSRYIVQAKSSSDTTITGTAQGLNKPPRLVMVMDDHGTSLRCCCANLRIIR
jgi:hypothetical protein